MTNINYDHDINLFNINNLNRFRYWHDICYNK